MGRDDVPNWEHMEDAVGFESEDAEGFEAEDAGGFEAVAGSIGVIPYTSTSTSQRKVATEGGNLPKEERVVGPIATIATNKDATNKDATNKDATNKDVITIMGADMMTDTLDTSTDDLDQRKSKLPVIVRRPLRFPDPALLPNWPDFQVPHAIPPTLPTVQKARKLSTRSLVAKLMDIHKDSPSLDDMTVQMALGWSGPNRNLYPESRRSLSESWHAHPAAKDTGGAARERVEMTIAERKKRPPPIQCLMNDTT